MNLQGGQQLLRSLHRLAAVNFCIQLARFGLGHSNQLAGLPHQRGDHPPCLDRLGQGEAPCFSAFLLPLGAPPPAPCIRQTSCPRTEGGLALEPAPLRSGMLSLDRAAGA